MLPPGVNGTLAALVAATYRGCKRWKWPQVRWERALLEHGPTVPRTPRVDLGFFVALGRQVSSTPTGQRFPQLFSQAFLNSNHGFSISTLLPPSFSLHSCYSPSSNYTPSVACFLPLHKLPSSSLRFLIPPILFPPSTANHITASSQWLPELSLSAVVVSASAPNSHSPDGQSAPCKLDSRA